MKILRNQLNTKFLQFKAVFDKDVHELLDNLVHGYITAFSHIIHRIHFEPTDDNKNFFEELLELMRQIIEFATQLSSDNICTWILDDIK